MIRIGNQTACWAKTPNEPFDFALAQGFGAFEWFPDKKPGAGWDETDLNIAARRVIREAACDRGMRLSVHAKWQANPLMPSALPLLWTDLELARDLGAALLNIHLFHERGLADFVGALEPLVRRTAEAGIQLAIENTPHHSPEQFNELFDRLRNLGSVETGHVGMCLDLGHANLCSATLNDYLGFCDRLHPELPIIHLHLHENWGDTDSHLPLFTGPAGRDDGGIRGLVKRLRMRHYSGSIILEQWPQPPSLLKDARDRLMLLWNEAEKGASTAVINGVSEKMSASQQITGRCEEARVPPGARAPGEQNRNILAPAAALDRDFAQELAEGNSHCRSWREKLDFVRSLLIRDKPALTTAQLVDLAVYLRFLGTGEIACVDDGRHFRPAHHSRIASQILERLDSLNTSDNIYVIRRILPWLPSSAPAFQRPEPLTRIRDIAHRNDIDSALKREIKTTLQNKLHRCAGPEDLATSAAILQRISVPGAGYSADFVAQFQIFHEELKEFFNARSLADRLAALLPAVDSGQAELIRLFQSQKPQGDAGSLAAAFETLTALRRSLLTTARRRTAHEAHEFLLADIALEDHGFVLVSELVNASERLPGGMAWEIELGVLIRGLQNLALCGVAPRECAAVEAELLAWGSPTPTSGREDILRLKASILRCRRLAEEFSGQMVALFAGRAQRLGWALGVADHAIRVFAESVIRGHLIFQVAKLAATVLRRIRECLGLAAWDVLVTGKAAGLARAVPALEQIEREGVEPIIALVESAAGDEEIPGRVTGIVLAQEMPHLSHLGVRARQAGVVFACCEDSTDFAHLRKLSGQWVSLEAGSEKVIMKGSEPTAKKTALEPRVAPDIPRIRQRSEPRWMPLDQVEPEDAGGKAASARRLAEVAQRSNSGFHTPASLVLPFGVMEISLAASSDVASDYARLAKRMGDVTAGEIPEAARDLRRLVEKSVMPGELVSEVARYFGRDARLVVRSSANCEDLEQMAGAGLYESVINVAPAEVADAIRKVWSSLWTTRAVLSRHEAGIHHDQVHMAVLVQELVTPDYSFILHTVNPISQDPQEVLVEVVVGLGETLASAATRGAPYRVVCRNGAGEITIQAFANFSTALRPGPLQLAEDVLGRVPVDRLVTETLDYSCVELSRAPSTLQELARRLAAVGKHVEDCLGKPQDIEGALLGDKVYLLQARPQQGLTRQKDGRKW